MNNVPVEYVRELFEVEKLTYREALDAIVQEYGPQHGFSQRSLERYCSQNDIRRNRCISDAELDEVVASAVSHVGPVYGRRTIKGYTEAHGLPSAGENRIGQSLHRVTPVYQQMRESATSRQLNPIPYYAPYFGFTTHYDQNEKLGMYGVQYVCAIDGYSFFVTAAAVMPVKNNLVIYENVYRESVLNFGLHDQLLLDHGREFYLTCSMQERLAGLRHSQRRPAYRQVPSKTNNRIERFWSEINTRVTFPMKSVLRDLTEDGTIQLNNLSDMFCTSTVSTKLAHYGLHQCVASWNCHKVEGKGEPVDLMRRNNHAVVVDPQLLPPAAEAAQLYAQAGGSLNDICDFGRDPLAGEDDLRDRRTIEWERQNDSIVEAFGKLVNYDVTCYKNMITSYIDLTAQLSDLII